MGDINQFNLVKRHSALVRGPVLEVGSKDYGSTPDYRSLFPGMSYLGVDMSSGNGVDAVVDLSVDLSKIDAALGARRFQTIICFSVLEHCAAPFQMAANLTDLLEPGGLLMISAPFAWEIHGYPSDYWRFTPNGIRLLFPKVIFEEELCSLSTSKPGDIRPLDDAMARANLSTTAVPRGDYGQLRWFMVRVLRRLRALPVVFNYPYLHPPVMVNMIGRKS